MKTTLLGALFFLSTGIFAQNSIPKQTVENIPVISIGRDISLHIISPEPIQFVDLSTDNLAGDLPAENIARIKIVPLENNSGFVKDTDLGVVTIVGQSFMAQYKIKYNKNEMSSSVTNIQIQSENMQALDYFNVGFSDRELKKFSLDIIKENKPKKSIRTAEAFKLRINLNRVYVIDDYIFLDISLKNKTNISYSIDNLKFSIEDKKIYKATNNQSVELNPIYKLYDQTKFKRNYHNIYVFKKFTFPNSKVLAIRLLEEPISGRTVELTIKYSDILNADTF